MKRLFTFFAAMALLLVSSCSKYDDSALTGRVDDLENRVAQLEQLCKQMNTNISSLQTIVTALQTNDCITGITPVTEKGKEIGYTISFTKNSPITIYHGKEGEKGETGTTGNDGHTPVISVRQHDNGIYYWTLDGDWLTDDAGNKIKTQGTNGSNGQSAYELAVEKGYTGTLDEWLEALKGSNGLSAYELAVEKGYQGAQEEWLESLQGNAGQDGKPGADGITPKLKIENGYWYVSYDKDHQTWKQLGKATGEDGESMFNNVTEDNENVYFELTNGQTITIPKKTIARFAIQFDKTEITVLQPGEKATVGYTIDGATEKTIVRVLAQNGWKASVITASTSAGTIEITAPDPLVQGEILVFASNGMDRTVMAVIDCSQGTITVADNSLNIVADGGIQRVVLQTNLDYVVDIPDEAQTWLSVVGTRAVMREETLTFTIAPNDKITERFATVSLKNKNGATLQTIVFRQAGSKIAGQLEIHVETIGTLKAVLSNYDYASIKSLKINGVLNDEDFLVIYHDMPALRELDLSEVNISKLPARSFYRSSNVERIILPKSLTEIGERVFAESQLKEVHLYENLTTIGESAFAGCIRLANITIPASMVTIEESAFTDCNVLSSVVFEPNCALTAIANNTFANTVIQTITIPAQVATIGETAFSNCKTLHTVRFEFESKLTAINTVFKGLPALQTVTIPASVRSIAPSAFSDCTQLSNVFFEENAQLTRIGGGFSGSSSYGAFQNCKKLKVIQIPASVEIIEAAAFKSCTSLSQITFERESKLKTICGGYPDYGMPTVYHGAFSGCTNLLSIEIPASVQVIESTAFNGCTSLVSVVFEEGSQLSKICGGYISSNYSAHLGAFSDCTALTDIEIPAKVQVIEAAAFKNCSALKSVTFESDSQLETIGGGYDYSAGSSSPYNRYYYYGAFSDCINLEAIEIPNNVKTIEAAAFKHCTSLKKVTFAKGSRLTTIGGKYGFDQYQKDRDYGAFSECSNLEVITIPASVQNINESAFSYCTSLSQILFLDNSILKTIGRRAFYQCPLIHTVDAINCTLVTNIGNEAFKNSNEMRLFKIGTVTPPECYSNSFGQVGVYSVLKVPSGVAEAYKSAEGWKKFASITGLDE